MSQLSKVSSVSSPMGQEAGRVAVKWFPGARTPDDAYDWQRIIDAIIGYGFVDLVQQGEGWRVTLATAGTPSGAPGEPSPVKDMRAEVIAALKAAGKPVV
ncbi:MAG TPA: hypothetical protein VKI41_16370 [Vicinamibacteria bacterium]|nr:hypothetical protein [Vicinamibacteria bacterium]